MTDTAAIALDLARDSAQIDPYTRHDDMLDALARIEPLSAEDINAVFEALSDTDLTELLLDVNAKGDSGRDGLSIDEQRRFYSKLAGSLDLPQLQRVDARLDNTAAAALADAVGMLRPAQDQTVFARTQTLTRQFSDPQTPFRGEAHAEEFDLPPGGVPLQRPSRSRDSAIDRHARDSVLQTRELASFASAAVARSAGFVQNNVSAAVQGTLQLALCTNDVGPLVSWWVRDAADKVQQTAECTVSALTPGASPCAPALQDRIAPPAQTHCDLSDALIHGTPSLLEDGPAPTAEIVGRHLPLTSLAYLPFEAYRSCNTGSAEACLQATDTLVFAAVATGVFALKELPSGATRAATSEIAPLEVPAALEAPHNLPTRFAPPPSAASHWTGLPDTPWPKSRSLAFDAPDILDARLSPNICFIRNESAPPPTGMPKPTPVALGTAPGLELMRLQHAQDQPGFQRILSEYHDSPVIDFERIAGRKLNPPGSGINADVYEYLPDPDRYVIKLPLNELAPYPEGASIVPLTKEGICLERGRSVGLSALEAGGLLKTSRQDTISPVLLVERVSNPINTKVDLRPIINKNLDNGRPYFHGVPDEYLNAIKRETVEDAQTNIDTRLKYGFHYYDPQDLLNGDTGALKAADPTGIKPWRPSTSPGELLREYAFRNNCARLIGEPEVRPSNVLRTSFEPWPWLKNGE